MSGQSAPGGSERALAPVEKPGQGAPERTLAVIPARGGSKGVPRKNLREVAGKPLIAYTIETALSAGPLFHRVVVSTDDKEIAEVSRRLGADVPFLRPPELSGDSVPMAPVLRDAVLRVEEAEGVRFRWVCLLQPTSPFRTVDDLRAVLHLARRGGCDSVISVVRVFAVHPVLMKRIDEGYLVPFCVPEVEGTRRQDYQPAAYMRNGAIYLTSRDVLVERGSIWGERIRPYIMPEERSAGIDSEMDLKLVDFLMRERRSAGGGTDSPGGPDVGGN